MLVLLAEVGHCPFDISCPASSCCTMIRDGGRAAACLDRSLRCTAQSVQLILMLPERICANCWKVHELVLDWPRCRESSGSQGALHPVRPDMLGAVHRRAGAEHGREPDRCAWHCDQSESWHEYGLCSLAGVLPHMQAALLCSRSVCAGTRHHSVCCTAKSEVPGPDAGQRAGIRSCPLQLRIQ